MKKAIIIIGSPRKHSNTEILANEAQKGLEDSGISCEKFYLNDMQIKGCQACYYCKKNNVAECAIKDDMQQIHKSMQRSDGIIVATPIYFSDVTAQTKIWLDRLFPYIGMDLSPKMPAGKKAAFVFTQNQPNTYLFETHLNTFMNMVGLTGFEVKGSVIAANLDKGYKPMVTEKRELLEKAYHLGKNLLTGP